MTKENREKIIKILIKYNTEEVYLVRSYGEQVLEDIFRHGRSGYENYSDKELYEMLKSISLNNSFNIEAIHLWRKISRL